MNYWPQIAEVEVLVPNNYNELIASNVLATMRGANSSAYFRSTFDVADTSAYDSLRLRMRADDGYVVYIDGEEVARKNSRAGVPAYNAAATGAHFARNEVAFELSASMLVNGTNVLAVTG